MEQKKQGRKAVIEILMKRDGVSREEAENMVEECVEALYAGEYDALQVYLGLEDDYIVDIL